MPAKKIGFIKNRPPTPRQDAVSKTNDDTNHDEREDESNSEESVMTTERETVDKRDSILTMIPDLPDASSERSQRGQSDSGKQSPEEIYLDQNIMKLSFLG